MTYPLHIKLLLSAIVVYLTTVAGAIFIDNSHTTIPSKQFQNNPTTPPQNRVPRPAQSAVQNQQPSPIIGLSINLHHTDQFNLYLHAVDQLKDLGVNSLQLLTPAFQQNGASLNIEILTGPKRGPSRKQIVNLLKYAKQKNLRTALMPIILFTKPRGNEWRGKIQPEDFNKWWISYQQTLQYFTDIANEANVDLLCVGSELLSTERNTKQWLKLIKQTRNQFHGKIYYSTNWDHYAAPKFWNKLDLIGINGYWDLTTLANNDNPTDQQLQARWQEIRSRILAFGKTQNRPILLTEIGYPSVPWALKDPWNYITDQNTTADVNTQATAYISFLQAWRIDLATSNKHLAGVFFYEWTPSNTGGPNDKSMNIRNKPAQKLLKQWLNQ